MLFDLMEQDQAGVTLSETIDFPEITVEMYEDGEHEEVLNDWLSKQDGNTFSTSYFFQNGREFDGPPLVGMEELNILYKFCHNQVDDRTFTRLMLKRYSDENYIKPLWEDFRKNPIMFITSRREIELLQNINVEMTKLNYRG